MKDWKRFEKIIEQIHRTLLEGAIVRHDVKLPSKDGQDRQVDVLFEKQMGIYRIVGIIECKTDARPIGVEKVDAFVTKKADVGANIGVIISESGFTKGAITGAQHHGIWILTYAQAEEFNWLEALAEVGVVNMLVIPNPNIEVVFTDTNGRGVKLDPACDLSNQQGQVLGTVAGLLEWRWSVAVAVPKIGWYTEIIELEEPILVRSANGDIALGGWRLRGLKRIVSCPIPLKVKFGQILQDGVTQERLYEELDMEEIDVDSLMENPDARDLSDDEYAEMLQSDLIKFHGEFQATDAVGATFKFKLVRINGEKTGGMSLRS